MAEQPSDNAAGEDAEGIARRRAEIDEVDMRVVELLNKRAQLALDIGHLKGGVSVYRPEREAEVLRRVAAATKGPLQGAALTRIYTEVMSACRALEGKVVVAYLGPQGTFTEMAVTRHFGHEVEGLPCASMDEVFKSAESGRANFAVLPVENSTEGAVGRTMDLLVTGSLSIIGEVILKVRQNLMAAVKPGATPPSPSSFKRVYSHAQSLGQCVGWLGQHMPKAERQAVASNAEAARMVSIASDDSVCAIGPAAAAERYGLTLLATDVQDDARNMTRFLVLGKKDLGPTGRDRTSLVMSAPNRPGAMLEMISPFAAQGVSMTRIESRPARTGEWEYLFFVDIEGHQADAPVAAALKEIRAKAPFIKIFGSFPIATAG